MYKRVIFNIKMYGTNSNVPSVELKKNTLVFLILKQTQDLII